jgi:hypothetical protein
LPEAPSAVMRTSFYVAGDSATSAHPQQSSARASANSSRDKFLTRWVKRGLRDQADIYTAPLHRSELKWVIGLPVVTAGLIAIDKHASGALPRNPSSASADISDVGLFATTGAVGVLLIDGKAQGDSHAFETGVLGAEAMANSGVVYAVLQLIAERERPLQGTGQGHFFQTSGLDNSFPSGHTIITWTAASTIAHEYPKPWVEWLAYGTAAAVSTSGPFSKISSAHPAFTISAGRRYRGSCRRLRSPDRALAFEDRCRTPTRFEYCRTVR